MEIHIGLGEYLALASFLFGIGTLGFLTRRNVLIQLMSIELMLNSVNVILVAFNRFNPTNHAGQLFAFFVIAVAAAEAAVGLVDKAKAVAARLLEADVSDVVLDVANGAFHVAGAPALGKSWADIAAAAEPDELVVDTVFQASMPTYPFGSHVAVVEVDTETGHVRHLRHVACDDAGTMVNPMLLAGQVHGGVAQGVAQALYEEVRYDSDGNPITSNLADYTMISADLLPLIERIPMETPTTVNPLGAKGIGESGTIGSTPAVHSAVGYDLAKPDFWNKSLDVIDGRVKEFVALATGAPSRS